MQFCFLQSVGRSSLLPPATLLAKAFVASSAPPFNAPYDHPTSNFDYSLQFTSPPRQSLPRRISPRSSVRPIPISVILPALSAAEGSVATDQRFRACRKGSDLATRSGRYPFPGFAFPNFVIPSEARDLLFSHFLAFPPFTSLLRYFLTSRIMDHRPRVTSQPPPATPFVPPPECR